MTSHPLDKLVEAGLLKKTIGDMLVDNCYSEDVNLLCRKYDYVAMFMFGREKTGFSNNKIMKDWPRYGIAKTTTADFELRFAPNGEPLAFWRPHSQAAAHLYGELFIVPPQIVWELDTAFENLTACNRRWKDFIFFDLTDKDKKHKKYHVARGLMYTASSMMSDNRYLTLADLMSSTEQSAYYVYTKREDEQFQKLHNLKV